MKLAEMLLYGSLNLKGNKKAISILVLFCVYFISLLLLYVIY